MAVHSIFCLFLFLLTQSTVIYGRQRNNNKHYQLPNSVSKIEKEENENVVIGRGRGLWASIIPFRIAFVVVWLGNAPPPSSFQYFLSSVAANANLLDLLIFHENNSEVNKAVDKIHPPNTRVYDLGKRGITDRLALKMGQAIGLTESVIKTLQDHMDLVYTNDPKAVLEMRPAFGTVFHDYIENYTHWAYLDVDQILGDLPAWMSMDEFINYDIVTYCAGDNSKIYIRGPLTMFNLSSPVDATSAWKLASYMNIHLVQYFEYKVETCLLHEKQHTEYRVLFPFGCRMTPDESVFSAAVLNVRNINIKYSNKNRADPKSNEARPKPIDDQIYFIDNSLRFCPLQALGNTLIQTKKFENRKIRPLKCDVTSLSTFRAHMANLRGADPKHTTVPFPLEVDPTFPGTQKVIKEIRAGRPLSSTGNACQTQWIHQYGRCFPGLRRYINVIYRSGKWFHQKFLLPVQNREEVMVMHFRVWKRQWSYLAPQRWLNPPPEGGGRFVVRNSGIFHYSEVSNE